MARILVIEDDESLTELYQHTLVGVGHDVLTAHNGQEGLDEAKIFKPEIIISDFVMPKKSGMEVFSEIKNDPELKNCKLLLITSMLVDKDDIKSKGADDVLFKTDIMPDLLIQKVNSLLNLQQ
jgi:CheY-like chemotaxis protein